MKKFLLILGIFIFSVFLRLLTLDQIGRTWDELGYVEAGYKFVTLAEKGDFTHPYWYEFPDHPPLAKYFYGLGATFDYRETKDNTPIFTHDLTHARLMSVLAGALTAVIILLLGWRYLSPFIGVTAAIIFSLLPISLGYSQLASLESMRLLFYTAAIYCFLLFLDSRTKKSILLAGIVLGLALEVKQTSFLLLPSMLLIFFIWARLKKIKRKIVKTSLLQIAFIFLISFLTFFILWPMPWFHLEHISAVHNKLWGVKFSPNIWQITLSPPEVFLGKLRMTPIFYYLVYFFISIPLLILLYFFVGIKRILDKKTWILYALLIWLLVPFVLSVYSWRQHGLRYIIEIYAPLSLIAALGIDVFLSKFITKVKIKALCLIPLVLYLLLILWQIKPYYLEYYNEAVGGVNTVYKYNLFQIGWWGQGVREAGMYLHEKAPSNATVGLAISPPHVFPHFDNLKSSQWSKDKNYDYVVVNHYNLIREGFDDSSIKKHYRLVYEVKADQAVLVYVYKRK